MHLRLPNPPCIPDHSSPDAPLLCHTVKEGENMTSISMFYETNQATLLSHNKERLGPHPYNTTVSVGMQLRIPHPHPKPDLTKPCVPDKWGGFWSCYHVPSTNHSVPGAVGDQPIYAGQDLFQIGQLTASDPFRICELNPSIDCSPAFYCNQTIPGMRPCSVLIQPTYMTGMLLRVASTSCTPPADNSYSCARSPLEYLPSSDQNGPVPESYVRYREPALLARGPSPKDFNYTTGTGSDVAEEWYQAYMNLNAHALPEYQAREKSFPCLRRNADQTRLVSIESCQWFAGMHIKVPNSAACATADPNACFTITDDDHRAMQEMEACQKNNYTKDECKWAGKNAMAGVFLVKDWIVGDVGRNQMGSFFKGGKYGYSDQQCPRGNCPPLQIENSVQTLGMSCGDLSSSWNGCKGVQFRIPNAKVIAGGSPDDYQMERCSETSPGCSSVPDTSIPLNECVDTPGKHWCYRLQTYGKTKKDLVTGDSLWWVSQNVPSVPMNCVVDAKGRAIDCPLCPNDVFNCNLIYPLATVEIPIVRPPAGQCTLDAYQQCGGQGGPFGCCKGKCECQKTSDLYMQCQPPSGWSKC
jgi:hypothetical protein